MDSIKGLKKNIVLSKYTTYKIGGPADYFINIKNNKELKNMLQFADDNSLPIFILAGGSNVLFNDDGFKGLVIKMDNKKIEFNSYVGKADAGVLMNDLVSKTVNLGFKGLEWAGGLPGTFGGAIRGNAGCFGGETKDVVSEVLTMNRSGKIKSYSSSDCQFGYRDSIFKHNSEIILSATLNFKPGNSEKLKKEVFDHIKYRAARHYLPSCGSVFKNCPIQNMSENIVKKFKDKIKTDPFPIMPTAVLISAVGLAGKTIGGAKITNEHANVIVNFNNAKASDILNLIKLAKEKVKQKFGIELNEEVQFVGF